jgi:hypothetical protein
MLAQSLVEYGALESLATGAEYLVYSIRTGLDRVSDTTWVTIGGITLVLLVLWSRRSRRF